MIAASEMRPTRYFTGLPCKNGHIAERDVSSRSCLECCRIKTSKWAKANPDKRRDMERAYRLKNAKKIAEQKKAWRRANPEKHRAAGKRWKINRALKICDFDAMLQSQGGKCAICGSVHANRAASGRLCIDHCHSTGVVRGLLCHRCNSLLGHAKDNTETLRRAISYLEAQQ